MIQGERNGEFVAEMEEQFWSMKTERQRREGTTKTKCITGSKMSGLATLGM